MSHDAHAFQVDLRGLVDLLSQHPYSSPRVFIRGPLQNAADATTARRPAEPDVPDVPDAIRVRVDGGRLSVTDLGIGLAEDDARRFPATAGRCAKRGGLAGARREFPGQFGIGLPACVTVAGQIRVVTRSAREPGRRQRGSRRP